MKKLGKAVLFCLILTLLLALFNKILMPDTQFRADTKELGSEVDYIFLGTSNVFYCVNPVIIWNEKGYTGYDLSLEQAPLIVSFYQLKEELKKVRTKTVFLDCAAFEYNYGVPSMNQLALDKMPFSWDKLKLIHELGEDDADHHVAAEQTYNKISYLIPLYSFHERWKEIFEGTLKSRYHGKYEHTFAGYVANKDHYVFKKDYRWLPTMEEFGGVYETTITPVNREWFEKIRNLCEAKGVELVLVKTPSKGWLVEMSDSLKSFAKEEGVEYLEMNDENVITALSLDEQNDFCDTSSHFNIYGTEKISRYLAAYMEKKASYTDQRIQGTGINAYWNQLYETYLDYKNSDTE